MLTSWLDVSPKHDFSLFNLPLGIFMPQTGPQSARACTILGDQVIDLAALCRLGYFADIPQVKISHFESKSLNALLELGNGVCNQVRRRVQELFSTSVATLKNNSQHQEQVLFEARKVKNMLPVEVKNYVDFYSSLQHATNVGKMFRDEKKPLLPNWKHIPIGYHGRANSIVVSGTPFKRPKGQLCANESQAPVYAPSQQIDFELEMAFIISQKTFMGETITPDKAKEHIFGLSLFNDWSARDIQRWEYVPLGPFLGKSFASSLSPWVVSLEALAPFALDPVEKDTPELPYLQGAEKGRYDVVLEVFLKSEKMQAPVKICTSNYKHMYWTLFQQLAHMSSNGTPIEVGDVYASGTISGDSDDSYGSLLELCWKGTRPLNLPDGTTRSFLQDGDTLILKGYAQNDDVRVGFGEVSGTVLSAS